jgi:hypothetical protein
VLGRKTVERRCGSRLASRCPSCSALYAAEARALIRAGLMDPETGLPLPATSVTLTAPGANVFGQAGDTVVPGDLTLATALDQHRRDERHSPRPPGLRCERCPETAVHDVLNSDTPSDTDLSPHGLCLAHLGFDFAAVVVVDEP